jgi:hypothetical protein
MQYFEQCVHPKNNNNNNNKNKAKARPALYVRNNAGNNDILRVTATVARVWCKLLTCPYMKQAKIDDSCEGVVQTFDISFYGNGVELLRASYF